MTESYFRPSGDRKDPADLARPGDVVQCVDVTTVHNHGGHTVLVVGRYYRVVEIGPLRTESAGVSGYRLAGAVSRGTSGMFYAWRFRVVRKSDPGFREFMREMKKDPSVEAHPIQIVMEPVR